METYVMQRHFEDTHNSFIYSHSKQETNVHQLMNGYGISIHRREDSSRKKHEQTLKTCSKEPGKKKSTYSVILYIKFFSMQIDLKWCKKKKRICCCLGVKNGKVWKGGVTKAQGNWGADWLTVSMVVMVSQMYTCVKAIKLYTLNTSTWSKRGQEAI